jgi:hypothetical protein
MNKKIWLIIILFILIIIFVYNTNNNEYFENTESFIEKTTYFSENISNQSKPYLWQYWEGEMPDYISLCLETVDKHCSNDFNIVRLNQNNIKDYLPELNDESFKKYIGNINNLIIPQKVDIYRIMLLYKYGGMYIDTDIIVLQNPIKILDKLNEFDFIGFGCTGEICKYGYGKPSNWLLISKSHTILMKNILDKLLNKMKSSNKFEYHDLGKMIIWDTLNDLIKNNNYKYYHYPNTIDGTRDIDGNWVTSSRIFSNESITYDNENDLFFLIIYNAEVNQDYKKMSKNELLSKDWNFTKFINKSLK